MCDIYFNVESIVHCCLGHSSPFIVSWCDRCRNTRVLGCEKRASGKPIKAQKSTHEISQSAKGPAEKRELHR
jgi:hypothetical protein